MSDFNQEEMIALIANAISRSRREILWFSNDLERGIFDNQEICDAFKKFLIQTHTVKLTLIARHPEIAHNHQHALIPLFQRLSSKIEQRQANNKQSQLSFLILDKKVLIKQVNSKQESTPLFEIIELNRALQKEYLERFEKNYQDSRMNHTLRQLSL